ncbi:MAG: hypothetical protein LBL66_06280 [Clostridiales bacterium]|jgi:hypothetical protein|nr:hypothetical protein [Clostridiales bacterium]
MMKRKIKAFIVFAALCFSVAFASGTATGFKPARAAVGEWTLDEGGRLSENVVTGDAGAVTKLSLDGAYDLGGRDVGLGYRFDAAGDFETGYYSGGFYTARRNDNCYVKYAFLNGGGSGFEVAFYHQYINADTTKISRMEACLTYINSGAAAYYESLDLYGDVHGADHILDVYIRGGYFYIQADGLVFVPAPILSDNEFSVAMEIFVFSGKTAKVRLLPVADQITKSAINGEWVNLSGAETSVNPDATVYYGITDKSRKLEISDIYMRETLINATGYDVTEPIELAVGIDFADAPGPWWGLTLLPDPFGAIHKKAYETMRSDRLASSYNIDYSRDHGGILFYYDGLFATWANNGGGVWGEYPAYDSNAAAAGYEGSQNLDYIRLEIGASSSKVYYNGALLWDDLPVKQSDFSASGGRAYLSFNFCQNSPTSPRVNRLHIKGVNTPEKAEGGVIRVLSGDTDGIGIEFSDKTPNGDMRIFTDKYLTAPLSGELFAYEGNTLTVKRAFFADKAFGEHFLYAANKGGAEALRFNYIDSANPPLPAAADKSLYWYTANASNDIVVKVNLHGLRFSRVYGGGIARNDYRYVASASAITLTNKYLKAKGREWLAEKEEWQEKTRYFLTIETEDDFGLVYASQISLVLSTEPRPAEGGAPGADTPDGAAGTDTTAARGGCGSAASLGGMFTGLTLLCAAAAIPALRRLHI